LNVVVVYKSVKCSTGIFVFFSRGVKKELRFSIFFVCVIVHFFEQRNSIWFFPYTLFEMVILNALL